MHKLKRLIAGFLACAISVSALPLTSFADDSTGRVVYERPTIGTDGLWDGTFDSSWQTNGTGTEEDPYILDTPAQFLDALRSQDQGFYSTEANLTGYNIFENSNHCVIDNLIKTQYREVNTFYGSWSIPDEYKPSYKLEYDFYSPNSDGYNSEESNKVYIHLYVGSKYVGKEEITAYAFSMRGPKIIQENETSLQLSVKVNPIYGLTWVSPADSTYNYNSKSVYVLRTDLSKYIDANACSFTGESMIGSKLTLKLGEVLADKNRYVLDYTNLDINGAKALYDAEGLAFNDAANPTVGVVTGYYKSTTATGGSGTLLDGLTIGEGHGKYAKVPYPYSYSEAIVKAKDTDIYTNPEDVAYVKLYEGLSSLKTDYNITSHFVQDPSTGMFTITVTLYDYHTEVGKTVLNWKPYYSYNPSIYSPGRWDDVWYVDTQAVYSNGKYQIKFVDLFLYYKGKLSSSGRTYYDYVTLRTNSIADGYSDVLFEIDLPEPSVEGKTLSRPIDGDTVFDSSKHEVVSYDFTGTFFDPDDERNYTRTYGKEALDALDTYVELHAIDPNNLTYATYSPRHFKLNTNVTIPKDIKTLYPDVTISTTCFGDILDLNSHYIRSNAPLFKALTTTGKIHNGTFYMSHNFMSYNNGTLENLTLIAPVLVTSSSIALDITNGVFIDTSTGVISDCKVIQDSFTGTTPVKYNKGIIHDIEVLIVDGTEEEVSRQSSTNHFLLAYANSGSISDVVVDTDKDVISSGGYAALLGGGVSSYLNGYFSDITIKPFTTNQFFLITYYSGQLSNPCYVERLNAQYKVEGTTGYYELLGAYHHINYRDCNIDVEIIPKTNSGLNLRLETSGGHSGGVAFRDNVNLKLKCTTSAYNYLAISHGWQNSTIDIHSTHSPINSDSMENSVACNCNIKYKFVEAEFSTSDEYSLKRVDRYGVTLVDSKVVVTDGQYSDFNAYAMINTKFTTHNAPKGFGNMPNSLVDSEIYGADVYYPKSILPYTWDSACGYKNSKVALDIVGTWDRWEKSYGDTPCENCTFVVNIDESCSGPMCHLVNTGPINDTTVIVNNESPDVYLQQDGNDALIVEVGSGAVNGLTMYLDGLNFNKSVRPTYWGLVSYGSDNVLHSNVHAYMNINIPEGCNIDYTQSRQSNTYIVGLFDYTMPASSGMVANCYNADGSPGAITFGLAGYNSYTSGSSIGNYLITNSTSPYMTAATTGWASNYAQTMVYNCYFDAPNTVADGDYESGLLNAYKYNNGSYSAYTPLLALRGNYTQDLNIVPEGQNFFRLVPGSFEVDKYDDVIGPVTRAEADNPPTGYYHVSKDASWTGEAAYRLDDGDNVKGRSFNWTMTDDITLQNPFTGEELFTVPNHLTHTSLTLDPAVVKSTSDQSGMLNLAPIYKVEVEDADTGTMIVYGLGDDKTTDDGATYAKEKSFLRVSDSSFDGTELIYVNQSINDSSYSKVEDMDDDPYNYSINGYRMPSGDVNFIPVFKEAKNITINLTGETEHGSITTDGLLTATGEVVHVSTETDVGYVINNAHYYFDTDPSTTYALTDEIVMADANLVICGEVVAKVGAITKFQLLGFDGVIYQDTLDIYVNIPAIGNINHLRPTVLYNGDYITPSEDSYQDFSTVVPYTVHHAEGTTTYNVHVRQEDYTMRIYEFELNGVAGTINQSTRSIEVIMPLGTDLSNLTPSNITYSAESIAPAVDVARDFRVTQLYTLYTNSVDPVSYTVNVRCEYPAEKEITSYVVSGIEGVIDNDAETITLTVPYGMNLSSIEPSYISYVGKTITPGKKNAINILGRATQTYTVEAQDNSTKTYTVLTQLARNSDAYISSFKLAGVNGTIDESTKTITVKVPAKVTVTDVAPDELVYVGKSIYPSLTTLQDFESPVTYTIVAADNTEVTYTIDVKHMSDAALIEEFSLLGFEGVIDHDAGTITVNLPYGYDVSNTAPTSLVVSTGATVSPNATTPQNFDAGVTYTVTSEDQTVTKDYIILVDYASNYDNYITKFVLDGVEGKIINLGDSLGFISVDIKDFVNRTDLSNIVPDLIEYTSGATLTPAATTANDFTSPTLYTVNGKYNGKRDYVVNVNLIPVSKEARIVSFIAAGYVGVIDDDAGTITLTVPKSKVDALKSVIPNISIIGTGHSPGTVPVDLTNPVTYRVTAEEPTVYKDYTTVLDIVDDSDGSAYILAYAVDGIMATVNQNAKTINLTLPTSYSSKIGTDTVPSYVDWKGASINPAVDTPVKLETGTTYTVTSETGNAVTYTLNVTTEAEPTYTITVQQTPHGSLTCSHITARANETITLTAKPDTGYELDYYVIDGLETTSNTFTMPAKDIEVHAVFKATDPTPPLSTVAKITGFAANGKVGTIDQDTGIITFMDASTNASMWDSVVPDIVEWEGASISPEKTTAVNMNNSPIYRVTAEAGNYKEYTVKVVYTMESKYKINVQTTSDGSVSASASDAYAGETIKLDNTPANGKVLDYYTVDGAAIKGNTFVMPAHDVTVSAVFKQKELPKVPYNIIVVQPTEGGTVAADKTTAYEGDTVTLSNIADEGYNLIAYTVDGNRISGNTFTMPAHDVTVSAVYFMAGVKYNIIIGLTKGGSVTASASSAYPGDVIRLTEQADLGYTFEYFIVDGKQISSAEFTMPAHDVTVSGKFTKAAPTQIASIDEYSIDGKVANIDQANNKIILTLNMSEEAKYDTPMIPDYIRYTGKSISPSSTSAIYVTDGFEYKVFDMEGLPRIYTLSLKWIDDRSSTAIITEYEAFGAKATIDQIKRTIDITVPYSYRNQVSTLKPSKISWEGKTLTPGEKDTVDATNAVTYTVTAENGNTVNYTLNVKVGPKPDNTDDPDPNPPSRACYISYYKALGVEAEIDQTERTITLTLPMSAKDKLKNVKPDSIRYKGVSISPRETDKVTLKDGLEYTVEAEYGNTKTYTMKLVFEENRSKDCIITAYKVDGIEATIDQDKGTITLNAPIEKKEAWSSIVPENIEWEGKEMDPAEADTVDLTKPVQYIVQAEHPGSYKFYTVKVNWLTEDEEIEDDNCSITEFVVDGIEADIDQEDLTISLSLPEYEKEKYSKIKPDSIVWEGTKISPTEKAKVCIDNGTTYTVYSSKSSKTYTMVVDWYDDRDTACEITYFKALGISGEIDQTAETITLLLDDSSYNKASKVKPDLIRYIGESITPSEDEYINLTEGVQYTVYAENSRYYKIYDVVVEWLEEPEEDEPPVVPDDPFDDPVIVEPPTPPTPPDDDDEDEGDDEEEIENPNTGVSGMGGLLGITMVVAMGILLVLRKRKQ